MWIKYSYSCHLDSKTGAVRYDTPNIEIELSHRGKQIKVLGLIDSGCQVTNVNSSIARFLGINLQNCPSIIIGGATGKTSGYVSSLNMKLKDFGDTFESPAVFVDGLPVPVLLGQDNFFDTFKIKFEKQNKTFELSRVEVKKK